MEYIVAVLCLTAVVGLAQIVGLQPGPSFDGALRKLVARVMIAAVATGALFAVVHIMASRIFSPEVAGFDQTAKIGAAFTIMLIIGLAVPIIAAVGVKFGVISGRNDNED